MLLILDFDGVICNSTRECHYVSNSIILDREFSLERNDLCSKKYFYEHRKLVKTAGEFFIILNNKINKKKNLSNNDIKTLYVKNQKVIKTFEKKFYKKRSMLIKSNFKKWHSLNFTYKKVLKLIYNIQKSPLHNIHIVSLKDKFSIKKILDSNNLKNIPILGKEKVISKRESIIYLKNKYQYSFNEIIFIDDNVDHLKNVIDLNINLFLPFWNKELKYINNSKFKFISLHELNKIFS